VKNSEHLSVNVASIGTAVLSHYHYDHGGGLRRFLELNSGAKAILDYPVEMTYTGHCTGTNAFGVLKSVMGDRIIDIHTGSCFEV